MIQKTENALYCMLQISIKDGYAYIRRQSTRVTAVLGGLVTALGCLFTSFASQFHQLFFSYGTVIGVGVGLTRDCSTLMVAQYFKRRREFVEIFIVSGSGLGIALMSVFINGAISAVGWRLGLQAVTGAVFLTFILGTFYRSASLYHPQRRAILHLKNQKRKIKDKSRHDDRPPFFDFSTLRSRTVRILLAHQVQEDGLGEAAVLLQAYLGLAWALGCAAFGLVVVQNSVECRIARQYLCQAAVFMCGLSILALTAVRGSYPGYVLFAWIYGIFCGGYHYSLKMYTYERVRARNFARTWGFVQCSQAIPVALGVPISGYINVGCGGKAGYYFSSTCVLLGSLALFLVDLHRRRLERHKHTRANGTRHLCVSEACPQRRKLSFSQNAVSSNINTISPINQCSITHITKKKQHFTYCLRKNYNLLNLNNFFTNFYKRVRILYKQLYILQLRTYITDIKTLISLNDFLFHNLSSSWNRGGIMAGGFEAGVIFKTFPLRNPEVILLLFCKFPYFYINWFSENYSIGYLKTFLKDSENNQRLSRKFPRVHIYFMILRNEVPVLMLPIFVLFLETHLIRYFLICTSETLINLLFMVLNRCTVCLDIKYFNQIS
ncbi:Uncharacterized protein GBIM_03016 [Gryllus bimaculatus]|nr:Uncharacterized protein GBIM_03016 [Gryllus bimaculatus]